MGYWKNRWIQTPQRILMDPCIKQASVFSKRFWIIPWPLAYNRLELDCIRKIINFWYTFGWKWRVFVTIWDCRTHVRMTSMTSSVERTDLDFKISVALIPANGSWNNMQTSTFWLKFGSLSPTVTLKIRSRSPKPNQLFIVSQCHTHNLIQICQLVHEISCRQALFGLNLAA